MGYVECLGPKLLWGTFAFKEKCKFSQVANNIIYLARDIDFLISGQLGAAITTSYLYPQSAAIHYFKYQAYSIIKELNLIPDKQGEIILIQKFGNKNYLSDSQLENIANPLLIYAEFIKENNDRLRGCLESRTRYKLSLVAQ
jgi:hypothetical protein